MLWSDKYVIGNPKVDSQHKRLFDLIERLDPTKDAPKASFQVTISYLSSYTISHFRYEEAALKKANYPDLDAHIKHHREFEAMVARASKEAATMPDMVPASKVRELSKYLNNWLVHHILNEDVRHASFLNK